MLASAAIPHPRFAAMARPVSLLTIDRQPGFLQVELGLLDDQLHTVGDGVQSARVDVPGGEWLVWREAGRAMWIGERPDGIPAPVRRMGMTPRSGALITAVNRLADTGVWLREASLQTGEGWSSSMRATRALPRLASYDVIAASGIFVDREGQSARLDLTSTKTCWTDRPVLAVQWIMSAAHLAAPQ
jgi:hypothetical protein